MLNENSVSGQLASIVLDGADASMRATKLPATLWPEAVDH